MSSQSSFAGGLAWWLGGNLLGPVWTFAGSVIVAAGPWLVSVIALAIVSVTMTPLLGYAAVEDLRLAVVYAFCIAPLVAGPIGAIVGRMVGAEFELGTIRMAPALFLVAAVASGLASQMLALAASVALGLKLTGIAIGFIFLASAAALLWTSFAVLTALRAYRFLIGAFSGGMAFSVTCIMIAAQGELTTELLVWSFTAGIGLCVCLSAVRVGRDAVTAEADLRRAAILLAREMFRQRALCGGVFLAICAVWIDKWIYWLGPHGARSAAGYLHYSPYDSVMFVAHLSAIPSYAAMLIFHDGPLRQSVEAFRARVRDHSTYKLVRAAVDRLSQVVWSGLFTIVFFQAALTACTVLMAPAVAKWLDFSFDQLLMLRVGLIAVFLLAFLHLSCALVLVSNRTRVFAILQGGLLASNLSFSLVSYGLLGVSAYGFFASALMMAVVAFFVAYRALQLFDFHAFLGENDSLYAR